MCFTPSTPKKKYRPKTRSDDDEFEFPLDPDEEVDLDVELQRYGTHHCPPFSSISRVS